MYVSVFVFFNTVLWFKVELVTTNHPVPETIGRIEGR